MVLDYGFIFGEANYNPLPCSKIHHERSTRPRNSIAHGLCKGLAGCIDTKVTDLEFIQMVQEVIEPIALADYWISYYLSKLNQEPLLQIKPENYQNKFLKWVLDCNSEYWIPSPPYPYKI